MSRLFTRVHLRIRQILGYALFILLISDAIVRAEEGYNVTVNGNLIYLSTPYATKVFFGEQGFSNLQDYRLEIPIKDLIPKESENVDGSNPNRKKFSEDTDQLILHANDLYNRGKFNESLMFVEEVLRRDSKNTRAWIMKGSLMHVLGQNDLAKKAWQRVLELQPNNEQIKNILQSYKGGNP